MRKIHVTYRLPVSFESKDGKIEARPSAGGLVTALTSTGTREGPRDLWLGVPDINPEKWASIKEGLNAEFELVPTFLPANIHRKFYKGFSNSVLWPLFHYFPSFVEFQEDFFDAYKRANAEMATTIVQHYQEGDIIWIHDYHFMLLPALIRDQLPSARIGFFLHIPFPNFEVFRLLPSVVKEMLLQGVMGANLVGFQTWGYAASFIECIQKILGKFHYAYRFAENGYSCTVGVFPISIDVEKFHDSFSNPDTIRSRNELRRQYGDKKIIFSVDRLDYTKGVMYRLQAFELFLSQHPEWRGRVVFILVIVPSREGIQKYWERRQMIESNINRINRLFGNYDNLPITYHYQAIPHEKLTAFYTAADLALISPVRDGMNLVSKEFVASRKDQRGVLMLSELTGAADELKEAILFNPLDTNQMAEQIYFALMMPEEEQAKRMIAMQSYLWNHTVFHWAESFLTNLCRSTDAPKVLDFTGSVAMTAMISEFRVSNRRLILLDYDGTLVPFQPQPQLASPDQALKNLLRSIGTDPRNSLVIVSGRDYATLDQWLGDLPLDIVAEHGAFVKKSAWKSYLTTPPAWKDHVRQLVSAFAEAHEGSFVEEKPLGIAWHYRNMPDRPGFHASRALIARLKSYLLDAKAVVLDGNKVVEVKPSGSDKGQVIATNYDWTAFDFVLAIGDDRTDEDMFDALDDGLTFTIKVGTGPTKARYRLNAVNDVIALLSELEKNQ